MHLLGFMANEEMHPVVHQQWCEVAIDQVYCIYLFLLKTCINLYLYVRSLCWPSTSSMSLICMWVSLLSRENKKPQCCIIPHLILGEKIAFPPSKWFKFTNFLPQANLRGNSFFLWAIQKAFFYIFISYLWTYNLTFQTSER